MNEDEMIIPQSDDAPVDTSQNDGGQAADNQPTAPAEIEGALLDNDEVQGDETQNDTKQSEGDANNEKSGGSGENTEGDGGSVSKPSGPDDADVRSEDSRRVEQRPNETQNTQLEDPGEFQPKDYSFDVELADGSKIRIEKPEDIDKIPADADFGSPKNLMLAQAGYSKMVSGLDADKREYEASKEAYDKQQSANADLETRITTMMNEMAYLEKKGKLPAVADEYKEADWSDPEIAKQPGVKERLAVLEFRAKENEERSALGLSPMSVLEAASEMANQAAEQ
ncbi:MAG TPA: hypothetical protein VFT87_05490, partial [Candidatus Saccharimonadales bacterium]|nr:hypothetical protein [Candidatus Saccharimonadales bacterium]